MVKVLVLLAVFNGEKFLREQINSVLCQSAVEVFICFADDGSTDATLSILAEYACSHADKIVRIFPEKAGGRAGLNFLRIFACVDLSDFDYVAFADQDDVWHKEKLARGVAALNKSGASGYSAAVTAVWSDGAEKYLPQSGEITGADYLFEGAGQGCTFILRVDFARIVKSELTSRWGEVGGIYYHDWLVYAMCRSAGRHWYFDTVSTMRYRQHEHNDTGARMTLAGLRKRLGLIFSGWYGEQIRQISQFCSSVNHGDDYARTYEKLRLFQIDQQVVGRYRLIKFVVKNGRRRISDRFVLALMALCGLLK